MAPTWSRREAVAAHPRASGAGPQSRGVATGRGTTGPRRTASASRPGRAAPGQRASTRAVRTLDARLMRWSRSFPAPTTPQRPRRRPDGRAWTRWGARTTRPQRTVRAPRPQTGATRRGVRRERLPNANCDGRTRDERLRTARERRRPTPSDGQSGRIHLSPNDPESETATKRPNLERRLAGLSFCQWVLPRCHRDCPKTGRSSLWRMRRTVSVQGRRASSGRGKAPRHPQRKRARGRNDPSRQAFRLFCKMPFPSPSRALAHADREEQEPRG